MKKILLILSVFFAFGCSKSDIDVSDLASTDMDHIGEEPIGLPDDIPPAPEVSNPEVSSRSSNFSLNKNPLQLANGLAQVWNGCDSNSNVMGGYNSDTICGKGYFHPLFAQHLNKYFFECVEDAAEAAKLPAPVQVFVRHLGTYSNRNGRGSSALSMHAYARAIDIAQFNLLDRTGQITKISNEMKNYKGATSIFYDSFRACWKSSLPATCIPGKKEYNGSIGHPLSSLGGNNLHTRHIHLSFPFCAE
mgnify:CR=1 FL=1|tara:strand:+ start:30925 stop:31668 length:744 start_codon:yes stop_codon:yes gene_type:complete